MKLVVAEAPSESPKESEVLDEIGFTFLSEEPKIFGITDYAVVVQNDSPLYITVSYVEMNGGLPVFVRHGQSREINFPKSQIIKGRSDGECITSNLAAAATALITYDDNSERKF